MSRTNSEGYKVGKCPGAPKKPPPVREQLQGFRFQAFNEDDEEQKKLANELNRALLVARGRQGLRPESPLLFN